MPSDVVQQVTDYTGQATASQMSDDLVSDTNTQQTAQLTLWYGILEFNVPLDTV